MNTPCLRCFGMLVLLSLTACLPGAVSAPQAKCTGSAALLTQVTGECERTIKALAEAETEHIAVQTNDVAPFATVEYSVSVEVGTVSVAFTDSDGYTKSSDATPGQPASGSLRVKLDPLNRIRFDLKPVGGEARGVAYHVRFVCDCMP